MLTESVGYDDKTTSILLHYYHHQYNYCYCCYYITCPIKRILVFIFALHGENQPISTIFGTQQPRKKALQKINISVSV